MILRGGPTAAFDKARASLDSGILTGAPEYGFQWPCANTHSSVVPIFSASTLLLIATRSSSSVVKLGLDAGGNKTGGIVDEIGVLTTGN